MVAQPTLHDSKGCNPVFTWFMHAVWEAGAKFLLHCCTLYCCGPYVRPVLSDRGKQEVISPQPLRWEQVNPLCISHVNWPF